MKPDVIIERVPEGIRIRRVARLIEARETVKRAHTIARLRLVASVARTESLEAAEERAYQHAYRETFTEAELTWFKRPLGGSL